MKIQNKNKCIEYSLGKFTIIFLFFVFFIFTNKIHASIYYQHSLSIYNTQDNAENLNYNTMNNFMFLGATLGSTNRFVLGWSIVLWNRTYKSPEGTDSKINTTELGPRVMYFLNQERNFGISAAYHVYAKGSRTLATTGIKENISGNSYFIALSYHLRLTSTIYGGAAFVYQTLNISEATVDETQSKVSHSYSTYYPMLEFSLRFR
ncbi:MAG: hypothetical protein HQK51_00135 [Oligoflexia bacterium]|nr:hypothetical protein [Oligoflexia bacterium]